MTPATAIRIRKRATGRACSPAWPSRSAQTTALLAPPAQASGLQPLEAQEPDVVGGHAERR